MEFIQIQIALLLVGFMITFTLNVVGTLVFHSIRIFFLFQKEGRIHKKRKRKKIKKNEK